MNKIWLIFQREYLTRVKKRTFILATILTPLGFGLLMFLSVYIQTYEGDNVKNVVIVDEGNFLKDSLKTKAKLHITFSKRSLQEELADYNEKKVAGVVSLPKEMDWNAEKIPLHIYTDEKLSLEVRQAISNSIERRLRDYKMMRLGIDEKQLLALETNVVLDTQAIKDKSNEESNLGAVITTVLGMIMGFAMYLTLFLYGMMVMRSVMEEKTNRIVEVMISSVKPFELMLGKILGVAAVGFTQLAIWIVLFLGIGTFAGSVLKLDDYAAHQLAAQPQEVAQAAQNFDTANILLELSKINWWFILPLFVFYFLLGYLIYASLFAAVGASIGDDTGEAQSLTLPITIPIILAIYIMIHAVRQPDSSLSVFASLFPLFSPIVMPARLGFHPPMWQILTSMLILILSVILFVWLSGRIYRVGILLYGKKLTFKEMVKWIFAKA